MIFRKKPTLRKNLIVKINCYEEVILMKRLMILLLVFALLLSVPVMAFAWTCPGCDSDNMDSAKYCVYCGQARPVAEYCPHCSRQVPDGARYCPYCSTSLSSAGTAAFSWPQMYMRKVSVTVRAMEQESDRRQSYAGPGSKSYIGAGAYKPNKVKQAIAWFAEDDYVLVELHYQTVQKRLVYFKKSYLRGADSVNPVTLTGQQATLNHSLAPLFGPGTDWDAYKV